MNPTSPVRALAPLLLLPGAVRALPQGPPTPVRVAEVRVESVQDRRQVTGDVRAVRRAGVASREKGLVLEVPVREGQRVEPGAVLARLDGARLARELAILAAQREPASARIREMESDLEQAERDLAAVLVLAGNDAARPKELGDARTAREAAKARLEASRGDLGVLEARVADLEGRIADMVIRAPFAGTVLARRTEVGAWLEEGGAVVDLLSTGELEAWLAVPQQHLAALQRGFAGLQVRVDGTGQRVEPARYLAIPDVDPRARTFPVVAPLEASDTIAAGMSVTAWVPVGEEKEHLLVPRDAILRNDVGTYVYAAVTGGEGEPEKAMPVPVEVLFDVADRSVVRAGLLAAGSRVVVEGNERLYPTAPIAPAPLSPPAGGAGHEERSR